MWNEYTAACHAGNLERWIDLWIDEVLQMPPDVPRRDGKEERRKGMEPGFDLFHMTNMVINIEELQILGDLAYSHGTYTFDMTLKDGGETIALTGKFLDILEKQVDGSC